MELLCIECEAIPLATWENSKHSILDRMDMESIKTLKMEVSTTFNVAIEKRQQIEGFLQSAIAANAESLKELRLLAEKKSTNKIVAVSTKKTLKEDLNQAKEEVKTADKMWNDLTGSTETKVLHCFVRLWLTYIFLFYY